MRLLAGGLMRHGASNTRADRTQRSTGPGFDGLPPVLTAAQVAELLHLNSGYVLKLARRFPSCCPGRVAPAGGR